MEGYFPRVGEEALVQTVMTRTDRLARLDRPGRRERRAARRRFRRVDAVSAQLAQLHVIRHLLEQAIDIVGGGWVQGALDRL